jgi:uroporphyrin-III C-methyltransferase
VQFVTGHDASGDLPEDIDLAALADPGAMTVVFMGKRTFPKLATALIAQGLPPTTPAILAEAVGTPDQALQRDTVAGLSEKLGQGFGSQPALILYGPMAELGVGFD